MKVDIAPDSKELGIRSATFVAAKVRELVSAAPADKNIRVIVATGASQFNFIASLVSFPDMPWNRVEFFHLDEYVGLDQGIEHPASFRKYLNERLFSQLNPQPASVHLLNPDEIEEYAKLGDENGFVLPKPILNKSGCNLSFAGLKTAVLHASKKIKNKQDKYDLAASFQFTINEILRVKSKKAMELFLSNNKKNKKNYFVIAGGVASNKTIRSNLQQVCKEMGFEYIFPPANLCTDNAAMIAWAGIERYKKNLIDDVTFSARPRWPLDEKAPFLKGAGVNHS